MLKKIIFLTTLFLLFGFQLLSDSQKGIEVIDLKQEASNDLHLEISYFSRELKPLDWAPRLKKRIIETYKGIPINDSVAFYFKSEDPIQFRYDLYKTKKIDESDYLKFITEKRIDTLKIKNSKTPLKQGFIAIIGFYKNRQFIIADVNRNEDFSDDIKYEFDINFRKESSANVESVLEKLPSSDYSYQIYYKGTIQTCNRKLIFYPTMNESSSAMNPKEIQYISKFRFRDYWKGEKTIGNIPYDFYCQGLDGNRCAVFIKPKSIPFKKDDESYNNQFRHYANDTITLGNTSFKIDSINSNISKLYLSQLSSNKKNYGSSIGSYLKNYEINDLSAKPFKINDISKEKKYTLIDFWGTWCAPCLKMTPLLKKLSADKASKLNIIAIANDENANVVREYIRKKNINWANAFVDMNKNPSILRELQVTEFPTLILIDSNNKIVYRGGSLEEISKLIK